MRREAPGVVAAPSAGPARQARKVCLPRWGEEEHAWLSARDIGVEDTGAVGGGGRGRGGGDASRPGEMGPAVDQRLAPAAKIESQSGTALFNAALHETPIRTSLGLVVEYLTFGSAVFLAVSLYLTRKPMA